MTHAPPETGGSSRGAPRPAGRLPLSPKARVRLEFAAKSFLWCAFLGSLAAGSIRLQSAALAAEEHRVRLGVWTVASRPDWCTPGDVREVRDASGLAGRWTPLLDPVGGAGVIERMERSPRVRRVVAMRRRFPDRFEALLDLRRPVAAVRVPGPRYVEVDEEGRALSAPSDVRPSRSGRPLRLLTGSPGPAVPPGALFGPDVAEGAALAAEFERFSTAEHRETLRLLDEIDLTNFEGRKELGASEVLLRAAADASSRPTLPSRPTASAPAPPPPPRCVVEWGRLGAGDPCDAEPPFGAKASRMLQALRMFPRLEGLARVRVAFSDLVVVPSPAPRSR